MRPPAGLILFHEYLHFDGNRKPCRRPILDQCAIRMSIALHRSRCGFDFSRWRWGRRFVHDGQGACWDQPPHVTSATNLMTYLGELGLSVEAYRKSGNHAATVTEIKNAVRGRMGIIYFQHCFPRPDSDRRGSHIDFWNGEQFMNQVLRESAGGGLPHSSDLFATAEGVIKFSPAF
jgi:hypothetical protein